MIFMFNEQVLSSVYKFFKNSTYIFNIIYEQNMYVVLFKMYKKYQHFVHFALGHYDDKMYIMMDTDIFPRAHGGHFSITNTEIMTVTEMIKRVKLQQ